MNRYRSLLASGLLALQLVFTSSGSLVAQEDATEAAEPTKKVVARPADTARSQETRLVSLEKLVKIQQAHLATLTTLTQELQQALRDSRKDFKADLEQIAAELAEPVCCKKLEQRIDALQDKQLRPLGEDVAKNMRALISLQVDTRSLQDGLKKQVGRIDLNVDAISENDTSLKTIVVTDESTGGTKLNVWGQMKASEEFRGDVQRATTGLLIVRNPVPNQVQIIRVNGTYWTTAGLQESTIRVPFAPVGVTGPGRSVPVYKNKWRFDPKHKQFVIDYDIRKPWRTASAK